MQQRVFLFLFVVAVCGSVIIQQIHMLLQERSLQSVRAGYEESPLMGLTLGNPSPKVRDHQLQIGVRLNKSKNDPDYQNHSGTQIVGKESTQNKSWEASNEFSSRSASESPQQRVSSLISYNVHEPARFFNEPPSNIKLKFGCSQPARAPLPPNHPFNLSTSIRTKLNILVCGDSLSVEFGKYLQIMSGATNSTSLQKLSWNKGKKLVEGLEFSRVSGGGSVSYWRTLNFLLPSHETKPLPNFGPGWRKSWAKKLMQEVPKIDVLIFRVSHPWVKFEEVTRENLQAHVKSCVEMLNVGTIIFMTTPLNNNVAKAEQWTEFRQMNDRIRSFVSEYNRSSVIPRILLSDVELYMDSIIHWNAVHIKIADIDHYERLQLSGTEEYAQHIAQVCAQKVNNHNLFCVKNRLMNDGMHFCMETLGPRLIANWACLIQCTENFEFGSKKKECQNHCHTGFFELPPLITRV